ncbi:hypothetical protein BN1723_014251 [Verticillium longisporum]|uniref:Uncharacterized protein n=1 Tax=Verticillium longisporum TaxID=100787 RepID=A0A0G4LYG4_VERLO|nr:hypothetical protein BN1708_014578 [Verticillium longisporum]CRK29165.1 hypothetical protein BN1723_014251 [Verticillium longisporum]
METINRMREVKLDQDLDGHVKSLKSSDLLMFRVFRAASPINIDTEPPPLEAVDGLAQPGADALNDEATTLVDDLFASIAKLDQLSRASVLSELGSHVYELEAEDWPDDGLIENQRMVFEETE